MFKKLPFGLAASPTVFTNFMQSKNSSTSQKTSTSSISNDILIKNFNMIKQLLKDSVGLQLFNPKETVYIYTDASDKGAGGLIFQVDKNNNKRFVPISFFSKSFTPTQSRYSTLERELLGILLALTSNYLLLSDEIIVYTDHQALVSISKKNSMLNPRILKFLETLSTYPLTIKYTLGKTNPADFLSRFSLDSQKTYDLNTVESSSSSSSSALSSSIPLSKQTSSDDLEYTPPLFTVFEKCLSLSEKSLLQLKDAMLNNTVGSLHPRIKKFSKHFTIIDSVLYFISQPHLLKVVSTAEFTTFCLEKHHKYHGSPKVILELAAESKIFYPQAKAVAAIIVKNCKHCDLFSRFSQIPAPLHSINWPSLAHRFYWSTFRCFILF